MIIQMHTSNLFITNQSFANKNPYDATYVLTSSPISFNFGGNIKKFIYGKTIRKFK